MTRFRITAAILAAAAAMLGVTGSASAAFASSPPGSNYTINGTMNVGETLTMSLSGTSFTVNLVPGTTTDTSAISAVITTNDTGGYTLNETLQTYYTTSNGQPVPVGVGFGDSNQDLIPYSSITPLEYPAGHDAANNNGAYTTPFSSGGNADIASSTGPSASGGDPYNLSWQVYLSTTQPVGTYTGSIQAVALGN
jgi:hypothetical protein